MQFLFDNLAAILLGGTVFFILAATQMSASGIGIEQTAIYGTRKQVQTFSQWVQEDLTDIGENLRQQTSRFEMPTQVPVRNARGVVIDTVTSSFQFYHDHFRPRPGDATRMDTTRIFTRYRLSSPQQMRVRDSTYTVYSINREVQARPVSNGTATIDASAWERVGASPDYLSLFRVDVFERGGRRATSVERAEYLRLRISLVPPHANPARELRELHWGTTVGLRPF